MDDSARDLGDLVEAVLDVEQAPGVWVRVTALLAAPSPGEVVVRYLSATLEGTPIAITAEEINALGERFQRAYNRKRGGVRGNFQAG